MSQLYKLSEVEAYRAQVLLEESLKKLNFLNGISTSGGGTHGDELTQHTGEEISRVIQEQRDLERKYEELIAQRSQLKGLCNKSQYSKLQKEISDVAHRLRESNKTLCRSLKENPDIQGNLEKMKLEQKLVQDWLEDTKTDLIESSFANLVSKVEAEKRDQEKLTEVKRKEAATSEAVKRLEDELKREQHDNERDSKQMIHDIKNHKEELKRSQTISDIEYKFEEQKLRAREQDLLRTQAQREKKLRAEFEELLGAKNMEHTTHERASDFLEDKIKKLTDEKEGWQNFVQTELETRDDELSKIQEHRGAAREALEALEDRRNTEAHEQKLKEEVMRNAVLVQKQRAEQLQRMELAVYFLQDQGREYMRRIQERNAAKKGKKKKGGKKK